jgi:hypothetical protein
MNSGRAVSVQLALPPQIEVAMMAPAGAVVPTRNVISAAPSSVIPIHKPPASSNASEPSATRVMRARSISILGAMNDQAPVR